MKRSILLGFAMAAGLFLSSAAADAQYYTTTTYSPYVGAYVAPTYVAPTYVAPVVSSYYSPLTVGTYTSYYGPAYGYRTYSYTPYYGPGYVSYYRGPFGGYRYRYSW